MSDQYYSLSYTSADFKVYENKHAYSGTHLGARQVANFAYVVTQLKDPDMGRLIAEKFAQEFADKLNTAYLQGWKDSSDTADRDDESYWEAVARQEVAGVLGEDTEKNLTSPMNYGRVSLVGVY